MSAFQVKAFGHANSSKAVHHVWEHMGDCAKCPICGHVELEAIGDENEVGTSISDGATNGDGQSEKLVFHGNGGK